MHNKIQAQNIKVGDLIAVINYFEVKEVHQNGNKLIVSDVNTSSFVEIRGPELIENAWSADQFNETKKVTKTEAAELLVSSFNCPFTVVFEKSDGTERTIRGKLIRPEPLLGRSLVEDLDITKSKKKDSVRQVDHRTIKSLIVNNVKYEVK